MFRFQVEFVINTKIIFFFFTFLIKERRKNRILSIVINLFFLFSKKITEKKAVFEIRSNKLLEYEPRISIRTRLTILLNGYRIYVDIMTRGKLSSI